jgi:hypothetical protein
MTISGKMTMNVPGQARQDVPVEYYVARGWMHIKMGTPEMGERWMKMRLPEEMWDTRSQIDQQMKLLETAIEALSNWKRCLFLWNLGEQGEVASFAFKS